MSVQIAFILGTALAAAVGDPPRGADYVRTIDDARGACAVAWVDGALVASCPESVEANAPAEQIRAAVEADGVSMLAPFAPAAAIESKLRMAVDVAASKDGAIAIADAGGVVQVRAAGGAGEWRTFGAGVLARPSGVCFVGRGIAVSDARRGEVVVFGDDGSTLHRLGAGALREPAGIDVLADGAIVVADRLADCLWRFDWSSDAGFVTPPVRLGESGSNPGQFSAPRDVAVVRTDAGEHLLVADELNHRIQVLARDGAFVGFFGMHALVPRMGEGKIHYPTSLAVAPDGVTLAVAEAFEDRIQLLRLKPQADPVDPSAFGGEFISSHFGSDVGCGDDLLAVVDREIEAIAVCDARTTPPIHMCVIGGGGALPHRFGEISAIAIAPTGSPIGAGDIWVADRANRRIDVLRLDWDRSKPPLFDQFLPRLARSMNLVAFERQANAIAPARAAQPPEITDIEFDPSGGVVLLDAANRLIYTTDSRLRNPSQLMLPPELVDAEEMALFRDRIAVADPASRSVFIVAGDGAWTRLDALGSERFVRPSGVAFVAVAGSAEPRLVVSDSARDQILVREPDGTARAIGERGGLDEQFWDPQGIAHSPLGLIVIDRGNHRYERFTDGVSWNLTGTLGRYYDRKRRGSPGAQPLEDAPQKKEADS